VKRFLVPLALLSVLAFGVGEAGGRSSAGVTVTVQVIGKGRVTSEHPSGLSCGDGKKTCHLVFTSGSGTITLNASNSADDWHFDSWDGDCSGGSGSCDLSGSSTYEVTANFAGPPTTTSTLSVSAITGAATFPLSVTVTGQGTVTGGGVTCGTSASSCSQRETAGSTVTLTATPVSGQSLSSWGGDCTGTPTTSSCSVTMDSAKSVTATFTGTPTVVGPGTIPSPAGSGNVAGGGIDCGSSGTDCTETVLTGSTLTVVETPDPGFVFDGWSGACDGPNVACTVELSDDRSVSASWSASSTNTPHLLTVSIAGEGEVRGGGLDCSGPATCTQGISAGTTISLTATPEVGYVFTGWTGTGSCAGTGTTCTLTMDVDRTVTATFTLAIPLTVTVTGNGSVSGGIGSINCGNGAGVCSATFAQNATVTLVATPTTGAIFAGWTGACGGTATTCTVLMTAAKTVTATFTGGAGPGGTTGFALSVVVTGNGTVTGGGINCGVGAALCTSNQTPGASVTLTASPSTGATFSGWGGACTGTTPTCTVTMTAARSVSASFAGGTSSFELTVSVSGAGTVSGGGITCGNGSSACTAGQSAGSNVTLTAAPASGATFTGWGGACSGTTITCRVTMNAAKSVTATFTGGGTTPGTLTIAVSGRGTVSTPLGSCASTGPQKTCAQRFKVGSKTTLTATPLAGASFLGWGGSCTSAKTSKTCSVTLTTAKSVTARFSGAPSGKPSGGGGGAALTSRGKPIVKRAGAGFQVTLRFNTTVGGVAHVRGLRAGRVAAALTLRVAGGRATIGPFPVAKPGLYTFEVRLAGRTIRWRACLGLCGSVATAEPFRLTRQAPTVTRTGDVWSVTLHCQANQISDARFRVYRGSRLLVNQRFLGRATTILLGPFLLGPGSYTMKLTATDPYGRTKTLTWIVALAS
jgi:uncharacterized repeat protein (TIGR02543 family)